MMDDGEEVDVRGFIPINIFGMVDLATCCTYLNRSSLQHS